MSLGFLTESALVPKKGTEISVRSSSVCGWLCVCVAGSREQQ